VKNIVNKYRNLTVGLTLFGYLLIFFLNVFHFHQYNSSETALYNVGSDSYAKLLLSHSESACIVHQNFTSLHNLTFLNSGGIDILDIAQSVKLIWTSQLPKWNFSYSAIQLRAPPTSS